MKIISFCLYGTKDIYYQGLIKNIHIITSKLPDFLTYVYYGRDITEDRVKTLRELSDKVVLIPTNKLGAINTLDRLNPIKSDDTEIFFCRDADSRIYERDLWCMKQFIDSEKSVHCIRDHCWHKSKLMAGTIGFKVKRIKNLEKIRKELNIFCYHQKQGEYGIDEYFLGKVIYPLIKDDLYLHTSITAFESEEYNLIDYENNGFNFVGNIIEINSDGSDKPKVNYYGFDIIYQVNWLIVQKQFKLASHIGKTIKWKPDSNIIETLFVANYYADDLQECRRLLSLFKDVSNITVKAINHCNFIFKLLRKHGYKLVATKDTNDEPKNNEIMIYYGSFPLTYRSFPCTNRVYRNVNLFDQINHDEVRFNKIGMGAANGMGMKFM